MARARNQLLPMNLADKDVVGTMKDRQRIGASLADVDPMTIDKSVRLSQNHCYTRSVKYQLVYSLQSTCYVKTCTYFSDFRNFKLMEYLRPLGTFDSKWGEFMLL